MECAAALDVCSVLEIVNEKEKVESKQLLHRIVAMLTKLSHICLDGHEVASRPTPKNPVCADVFA